MKRALILSAATLLLSACFTGKDMRDGDLRDLRGIDITPAKVDTINPPEVSYSAEVLLARGEGYFIKKAYVEAAQEYQRFMELHATHPWAPYALYRQGLAYVAQIKSPDREPALATQARHTFENLIANYPDSAPVPQAAVQLTWVIDQLALHELFIARFYLRTGRPQAALGRLEYLRQNYPAAASARTVWFEIAQAREGVGDTDGAVSAYQQFLHDLEGASNPRRTQAENALTRLEVNR